jgi:hypothetical protein
VLPEVGRGFGRIPLEGRGIHGCRLVYQPRPLRPRLATVGRTPEISCKAPICSGFVNFIPLFDSAPIIFTVVTRPGGAAMSGVTSRCLEFTFRHGSHWSRNVEPRSGARPRITSYCSSSSVSP